MLKKDLIARNPLRILENTGNTVLNAGQFGMVAAMAGVGKTAMLVQLAMDSILNGKNVLHISIDQPVKKVVLWYDEVFNNIKQEYHLEHAEEEMWENILPHRFIMTYNVETFKPHRLEERINDLTEQGIFMPQVAIIDGLRFDQYARDSLTELKIMAKDHGFPIWFSATIPAADAQDSAGLPESIANLSSMFEVILQLKPVGQEMQLNLLKGPSAAQTDMGLRLDPATMLVHKA
jgi:hypothetical protein